MIVNLLLLVAALVVALVVIAAFRAKTFRVSRRATLPAPPAAVFARINEPRAWQAWSPWEKLDPALRRTYEGPTSGVDASYAWEGNKKVGSGRMTVVESRPFERIRFRLEFLKPFPAVNTAEFTLAPVGADRTEVTWTMTGEFNLLCRTFSIFMNMDKMVGGQFEQGLANLATVVAGR